jgi:hypothetical protein
MDRRRSGTSPRKPSIEGRSARLSRAPAPPPRIDPRGSFPARNDGEIWREAKAALESALDRYVRFTVRDFKKDSKGVPWTEVVTRAEELRRPIDEALTECRRHACLSNDVARLAMRIGEVDSDWNWVCRKNAVADDIETTSGWIKIKEGDKFTKSEVAIFNVIRKIWPNGIPDNLLATDRDNQIATAIHVKEYKRGSSTSNIKRLLRKIKFVGLK